jgi:putative transposase
MCRVLKVHRSGYYAWKLKPLCDRAMEDAVLLVEIKQSFDQSHGIYGSLTLPVKNVFLNCGLISS